jgi:protein SCO1
MRSMRRSLLLSFPGWLLVARAARAGETMRPFMLEDVNGQIVDDGTFQGRVSLVFFGYTLCPDVCPTAMLTVSNVLKALGSGGDKVLPLFVSLDPKRDSRRVLSDYAGNFDPRIVPLRGPESYIEAAAKAFGVTYRVVTPDKSRPEEYAIDHTALIFLVGPDGRIDGKFGHAASADQIAARVKDVLASVAASAGN